MVQYCRNRYGQVYQCRSTWSSWGRWLALGLIIAAAIFFFFFLSCLTNRRRRKAGRKPMYGTGWVPVGGPSQNTNTQQYPQNNHNSSAPAYNTNNNGGYHGQNQGYFGGQQTGADMQAPPKAYSGNETGYMPPSGPPPNKY